jgi:hypothetical protein
MNRAAKLRLGLLAAVVLVTAISAQASGVNATARVSATIIAPAMVDIANTTSLSLTANDLRRGAVDLGAVRVASRGAAGGYQLSASLGGSVSGATLSRTDGGVPESMLTLAGAAAGQTSSALYLTVNNY